MRFFQAVLCFFALISAGLSIQPTYNCPAPVSPPNGQAFLYQNGNYVKYRCDAGYKLVGARFARCRDNKWIPDPPFCIAEEAASAKVPDVTTESSPTSTRPLFKWDDAEPQNLTKSNSTVNGTDDMLLSDEARLHMLLYPERRYVYQQPLVMAPRSSRVLSGTELEEEEKKRSSKQEKTSRTVHVDTPSVVYVRRGVYSGKSQPQFLQPYHRAAVHMVVDNNGQGNRVEVVSVPRAAVSQDDKGGQSEETLRYMYWMAQNGLYPRHAPLMESVNGNPVVLTLSESQLAWINSLHPELRDQYLKDIYATRAKEAEEAARAQAFLRRYEDAYSVFYNRPYYVRQPVSVLVEDPVASYDYSCFRTDSRGQATLIRAPKLPNAYIYRYDRRQNPSSPRNDYLTAEYRCKDGYTLLDPRHDELHCRQKEWVGVQPYCIPREIDECAVSNKCQHLCHNSFGSFSCSCLPGYILVNNFLCEECRNNSYYSKNESYCIECPPNSYTLSTGRTTISDCLCKPGFIGDLSHNISCEDVNECDNQNFGCSNECVNTPGSAHCSCAEGFYLENNKKTCKDINECLTNNGGCQGWCANTNGSFLCGCHNGYVLSSNSFSCIDTNECLINNGGCNQRCNNYAGGYFCACRKGFVLESNQKTCTAAQCKSIPKPAHSVLRCIQSVFVKNSKNGNKNFSNSYPVGTKCVLLCNKGFELSSNNKVITCKKNGRWNAELPECLAQQCSPLTSFENGEIHPVVCSTGPVYVLQKCHFTCNYGYNLVGNPTLNCGRQKKWKPEVTPVCKKVTWVPFIVCPDDVTAILPINGSFISVVVPVPKSNVDAQYIHSEFVEVGKQTNFTAGSFEILFTARNPVLKNISDSCTWTVTILDVEPPQIIYCPESFSVINKDEKSVKVNWNEPVFSDNVEVKSIYKTREPNSTFQQGVHIVTYTAIDSSGNSANCSFLINVANLECSDLENPKHGYFECADWVAGKICELICEPGFVKYSLDPSFVHCDDSGNWTPNTTIQGCLHFVPSVNSSCPPGFELENDVETDEEICVECPENFFWLSGNETCIAQ